MLSLNQSLSHQDLSLLPTLFQQLLLNEIFLSTSWVKVLSLIKTNDSCLFDEVGCTEHLLVILDFMAFTFTDLAQVVEVRGHCFVHVFLALFVDVTAVVSVSDLILLIRPEDDLHAFTLLNLLLYFNLPLFSNQCEQLILGFEIFDLGVEFVNPHLDHSIESLTFILLLVPGVDHLSYPVISFSHLLDLGFVLGLSLFVPLGESGVLTLESIETFVRMFGYHLDDVETLGCVVGEEFQFVGLLPMSHITMLRPLEYMVQHLIFILLLGNELFEKFGIFDSVGDLALG